MIKLIFKPMLVSALTLYLFAISPVTAQEKNLDSATHELAPYAQRLVEILKSERERLNVKYTQLTAELARLRQSYGEGEPPPAFATEDQVKRIAGLRVEIKSAQERQERRLILENLLNADFSQRMVAFYPDRFTIDVKLMRTTTRLNLRAGPGKKFNEMGIIPVHERLVVVAAENRGEWRLVSVDGKFGYVWGTYLEQY